MKKILLKSKIRILFLFLFFAAAFVAIAQPELPPDHGLEDNQTPPAGGGAPIGSGLVILLSLGAAYGGRKLYTWKQADIT